MTDRLNEKQEQQPETAQHLAALYGYANVMNMAASLPKSAMILDIGPGMSPLGNEIALYRGDISWTNVDPVYDDIVVQVQAETDKPFNVDLEAWDLNDLES